MSHETPVQPNLADLFTRYLDRQAETQAAGIVNFDGEVTPYEVGPVQPLDPKLAWDEALAVLPYFAGEQAKRPQAPPHWAQIVGSHDSVLAIAFGVGNFPQLMRNFHDVFSHPNLSEMRPTAARPASTVELKPWVEQIAHKPQFPQMLLALGSLRLARQFDAAEKFVRENDANVPAKWRAAWDNEKASLAWHAGRYDEARQAWDGMQATAPVLFNRGMAALFAGDWARAKEQLNAAVAELPARSAWHHLGRFYLTLAELRRQ
jgi:tetratricopeptide (TPR) repeat protein